MFAVLLLLLLFTARLAQAAVPVDYDNATLLSAGHDDDTIDAKARNYRVNSDPEFQRRCVELINRKRYLHESTPMLVLADNLTDYTIDRAYSILRDIENKRDIAKGKHPFGESFFWYYDPRNYRKLEDAINTWYEEHKDYDYNRPGFSAKTGGFSQMVWKESREASCIKVDYEIGTSFRTLVVANYWPAGNVEGEFPYNVLPKKRSQRPDLIDDIPQPRPPTRRPRPPIRPTKRPDRPDYDPRPPNRPDRPDYDPRPPNRPVRPPSRPDYDPRPPYRPNRPRPPHRPPYEPSNPDDYPTHPIATYPKPDGNPQPLIPTLVQPPY